LRDPIEIIGGGCLTLYCVERKADGFKNVVAAWSKATWRRLSDGTEISTKIQDSSLV